MTTILEMIKAFDDCYRNKHSSASAVSYEAERMFEDIPRLTDEINNRTYEPGQSIVFVVRYPRYREVFAASFRDRIVHHWMCMRLQPIIEKILSPRRFNCRKGKGTLAAVRSLRDDIRYVSRGYTADCWIAKGDIKGFFMSIDRRQLADITDRLIVKYYDAPDKEDLRWVANKVVMHAPERNCRRNSPKSLWLKLAADKSLFTNGENRGVPIGNLPSQELANLLLHCALDFTLMKIEREAAAKGITFVWDAYVDDFAMVCDDKAFLLSVYPRIRQSLAAYGLRLNERKNYVQHYTKSVQFVGQMIRLRKSYTIPRVARKMAEAAQQVRLHNNPSDLAALKRACATLNSYLGLMVHGDTWRIRRTATLPLEFSRCVFVGADFERASIRKIYRDNERIRKLFDKGNPWELSLASPLWDDTDRPSGQRSPCQRAVPCNRQPKD